MPDRSLMITTVLLYKGENPESHVRNAISFSTSTCSLKWDDSDVAGLLRGFWLKMDLRVGQSTWTLTSACICSPYLSTAWAMSLPCMLRS